VKITHLALSNTQSVASYHGQLLVGKTRDDD